MFVTVVALSVVSYIWYFSVVSYYLVCISFQSLVEKKQNGFRSVLCSMKETKCVELY
jgi:hypothetical protein